MNEITRPIEVITQEINFINYRQATPLSRLGSVCMRQS